MSSCRNLILFSICILAGFATPAFSQLPQIDAGLAYLTAAQSPDGNWDSASTQVETTAATATALESLKLLNQTGSATYGAGSSWLQAQAPQSVDFIAERILSLDLADGSADTLLPALDALKGGWGGYDGYAVNLLDTAYALRALQAVGGADDTTTNAALAFLTTQQNPDGGWGFLPGDASHVYLTAEVSLTLQQFPQMPSIAAAVSRASTFLVGHRNADGGFGSSPSTVYETALAYKALAAVSDDPAVTAATVNYLTTTQAADGSWGDDPYSTALALQALYLAENKPSPPPPPPPGGTITGILVDATTHQHLGGVAVVLASNPLLSTSTDSSGNFVLHDIPAGTQQVSFSLEGYKCFDCHHRCRGRRLVRPREHLLGVGILHRHHRGHHCRPAGQPLAGVAISVNGAWNGGTHTGADGSFAITYVTPGAVTISAAKEG